MTAAALLLLWLLAGVAVAQLFRVNNMKRHDCQARQYGDQMICAPCGLTWDTNDPEPPECRKVDRRTKKAKDAAARLDAAMTHAKARKGLPHELPDEVAVEMVKTYQANARDGLKGQIAGMQAAYRLFLDRVEL